MSRIVTKQAAPVTPKAHVDDVVPPPSSMTVTLDRQPVLYLPDGRVLVRVAGFRA